ncbi:hypothetical protein ACWD5B_28915 [Streptomyces tanashiensis]
MDTPTYEPAAEPDYTPRANTILSAPATPADCARDYAAAGPIRTQMDKQDAR